MKLSEHPAWPYFNASSVVVIGASADYSKNPGKPLYYLARYGFLGKVAAVNPKYPELFGRPCYSDVDQLPEPAELALVMLPSTAAVEAVRKCALLGVRACVVFGSGFADAGNHDLQVEMVDAARASGMSLLGPNCLGAINTSNGLTATFSSFLLRRMFRTGRVGLVTQSGSIGNGILLNFQALGIGLGKWVATGNEADLDVLDFAEFLVEDPETDVIAIYVEAVQRGWRWREIAARARAQGKPLIVLKAGTGSRSHRAVTSHSGRLAGAHRVWEDVARQNGIVTVETIEELCDDTLALSVLPRISDRGVAMIGTGGSGVLLTDECERRGVPIAEFSTSTKSSLRLVLPPAASVENPIDPGPVPLDVWQSACSLALDDPNVGAFVAVVNSLVRGYTETMEHFLPIVQQARRSGKVLALSYLAAHDPLPEEVEHDLAGQGVLVLPDPARVASALAAARSAAGLAPFLPIKATYASQSRASLSWAQLGPRLLQAEIPIVMPEEVFSAAQAAAARKRLKRIVMKLEDPSQAHKTEAGLVRLNIGDDKTARDVFDGLRARAVSQGARVTVQRQIDQGVEVLVGCTVDNELGRIVTIGPGGVLAELVDDVVSTLVPVRADWVQKLISETRLGRLLAGYRGGPAADINALCRLIEAVTIVFAESADLIELEINPVIVLPVGQGAWAVDALGVVAIAGEPLQT